MSASHSTRVTVVGGGFTGLSIAYELAKRNIPVTVLESGSQVGGLAASFEVGGTRLECFYHHWFTNDLAVMELIDELGLGKRVSYDATRTGMYYANSIFRLSTPFDVLRFTPLPVVDRVRLGLLALRARRVHNWKELELLTASEWLRKIGGENVYKVIWKPLLIGKFGAYADSVSAVWIWNKIKLRGGSRGKGGEERLAYFEGGFAALAESIASKVRSLGGCICLNSAVHTIHPSDSCWTCSTPSETFQSDRVVVTTALPLAAQMIRGWAGPEYVQALRRIQYLANICLVLEIDRSLSNIYWLNVNDPGFPFVGVIEHTNFEKRSTYGGNHIVYLSKYLPHTDRLYAMNADELFDYALPYLKRMFPALERSWIRRCHLWRARWAQPVVERGYSRLIPAADGPRDGFHICSMAQVYPEDRGTNYSIRDGRKFGVRLGDELLSSAVHRRRAIPG